MQGAADLAAGRAATGRRRRSTASSRRGRPGRRRRLAAASRAAASSTASPPPRRSGSASIAEVPSLSPGQLRHAASRVVGHFADHGVPDARRPAHHGLARRVARARPVLLRPRLAVLGGQGPARHRAAGRPPGVDAPTPSRCPSRRATRSARSAPPGWIVVGHAGRRHRARRQPRHRPRRRGRLGRRLAALRPARLLDRDAARCSTTRGWAEPLDQSVAARRRRGPGHPPRGDAHSSSVRIEDDGTGGRDRRLHRRTPTGSTRDPDAATTAWAGSTARSTVAGRLTVYSLVRGPWEVRLSGRRARGSASIRRDVRLRIGGWPVAGPADATLDRRRSRVAGRRTGSPSSLAPCSAPACAADVAEYDGREPARRAARVVPWLEYPVDVGAWMCVARRTAPAAIRRRERARPRRARRPTARHRCTVDLARRRQHDQHSSVNSGPPLTAAR